MEAQLEQVLNDYQRFCNSHSFDPQIDIVSTFHEIKNQNSYLYRTDFPGHLTGTALVLSNDRTKILLNHHKKLKKWIFLGGHADGNPNIYEVALREAQEESGMLEIYPITTHPIDLDIHTVPKNGKEPGHLHYDMRYLFYSQQETISVSEESIDLQWVDFSKVEAFTREVSVLRAIQKARHLLQTSFSNF